MKIFLNDKIKLFMKNSNWICVIFLLITKSTSFCLHRFFWIKLPFLFNETSIPIDHVLVDF